MRAALTIAAKDLRLRLRDRSAFIVGIVAPFVLAFILNTVVGGAFDAEDFSASYGVVDQGGGEVAANFVQALEDLDVVDIELTTGLTEDRARAEVDDGDLDAAFVIPAGFSQVVSSPDVEAVGAEIRVVGNVDATIATQIATAIAEGFADRVNAVRLSVATATASATATDIPDIGSLVEAAAQEPPPVRVEELTADERELDGTTYLIAGMSVLFLFFLVQFGVTGLFDERREGTLPRLLAAPIPRLAIPAAKTATSIVLGVVSLTVLVAGSTTLMGADWGDPAAVVLLGATVVLAATSIMGVVAAVARTPEQAGNAQAVIAMVLAVLGGSFFPVTQAGGLLQRLATLTPHHWFLRGLGEASAGGVGAALPALGALLAFTVVVGAVGVVFVPRMVEP
jgi:ABC-2 type transport system permease protein